MNETIDDGFEGQGSASEIKARISSLLTPGESVLWAGRPEPAFLVRQSLPKAFFGFGFIAFTLAWMFAVVRGGHNNWDKGRAVAPFAPHNVLIAACAGLWLLPVGLYILTWPLRTRRKARKTIYVLTDRRAVVIEPALPGGDRVDRYPPEALALMRCDEREDGSGDLVFENRKTWVRMPQAIGFLAVERVRAVEALVRKALFSAGPSTQEPTTTPTDRRTYRIAGRFRLFQALDLAVIGLLAFCLVGNLILALAALILMRGKVVTALAALATENGWPGPLGVAGGLVGGLGTFAIGGLVVWIAFRFALATPTEIVVTEGGEEFEFRSWLRTTVLRAGEMTSITTGGWVDSNGCQAVIRHKSGTLTLVNLIPDFRDLLATIKALNPAVEIRASNLRYAIERFPEKLRRA